MDKKDKKTPKQDLGHDEIDLILDKADLTGAIQNATTLDLRKLTNKARMQSNKEESSISNLNDIEKKYWNKYVQNLDSKPSGLVTAGFAGDIKITDRLIELYLSGKKTAGSSLKKGYYHDNEPLPKVGDHWIVLNSQKKPTFIAKTIKVEHYLFKDVPERVAIAEGEGALSLKYWRSAHEKFFSQFFDTLDIKDIENEVVIVEHFEIVHVSKGQE